MGQEQKELTDSHFALGFWQETRVLSTPPSPLEESFLHVTGSNPAYLNPRLVQLNLECICPADGKSLGSLPKEKARRKHGGWLPGNADACRVLEAMSMQGISCHCPGRGDGVLLAKAGWKRRI